MASETTMAGPDIGREPFWRSDAAKAVAAMLIVAAISSVGGFGRMTGTSDNDSLLRLVQVRDLIAGQGWFDLHQYRMGLEGALPMHWSRLVDAPIAAIILSVTALTGSQSTGEIVAMIAWPFMLYAVALYLLLRIGRLMAGEEAIFPLAVIGAVTLYQIGIFVPGALDHHNVQLVLMLAMVFFLLRAAPDNLSAWPAGATAVLMLAVGMETAPYVAAGGLFVVGWYLVGGRAARGIAAGFGAAFALTSGAVFIATVPPSTWGAAYCDAFSVAQFAVGAVGGAGLAAIALSRMLSETLARRALSLAALGAVTAALLLVYFPQCLRDPYADLAPMLQTYWLSAVAEAQPLWKVVEHSPGDLAGYYATTLIGLLVLGLRMRRTGLRREDILIAFVLLVALLVSVWQVRGTRFSAPLACVPLAIWVAGLRQQAMAFPGTAASLKLVGAWLVSLNMVWAQTAQAMPLFKPSETAGEQVTKEICDKDVDFDRLAGLPADTVLTISNLGAPVLRFTQHRVLAGPYHRNIAGNVLVLETLMGPSETGLLKARESGVGLVTLCRGNAETGFLSKRAPDGLLAALAAGKVPDWLEIVPESAGEPLELYRVLPPKP
ncbi:GtrA family protein [Mesorhizobium sp. VNQ89]|uniref:GtrA family protein n=1 Tax=Mesorhizobium quangtriensis TaxID=3157709 RepID=UPI0032B73A44